MADVFLSYSRQDKALAARFVELLEGLGWDVFWDQETRAGMLWPKVLEDELNKARCLLVLWTANSVASRWVRIEAYEALQNDKLLPVRLENVKPPLEFRQTQIFDLVGWTGEPADPRLPRLFEDLAAIAKCAPPRRGRTDAVAGDAEASRPRPPTTSMPKAARTMSQPLEPIAATSVADPEVVAADDASPNQTAPEPAVVAQMAPSPGEYHAPALALDAVPTTAEPGVAAAPDHESAARTARAEPTMPRSRRAWMVAIVASAVASVWLLRAVMTPEEARPNATLAPDLVAPATPKSPAASATSEASAAAAPIEATPARAPAPAEPTIMPAAGKVAAQSPPRAASGAARATPGRCIEIAEKFQTTGQLTDEERRFLSSKECAK